MLFSTWRSGRPLFSDIGIETGIQGANQATLWGDAFWGREAAGAKALKQEATL